MNKMTICSQCCAMKRNPECEGCSYYEFSKKYEVEKNSQEDFIIEINEEIDRVVDEALAMVECGDIKKGDEIITKLLNDHPDYHMLLYAKGVIFALKDQLDRAIELFKKAADIFPYFIEAHYNLAVAYQKKLEIGDTINAYKKVVAFGATDNMYVLQAKKFLSGVEKEIFNSNGINLDTFLKAQVLFEQGISLMEQQKWEKAIDKFKTVLSLHKQHYQSYGNMGLCYAKLGKKNLAIDAFDKAMEINPEYEVAIVNREVVKSLADDEKPEPGQVETVDYARDYTLKGKSYIKSMFK